jgi:hypothetical protein
MQFLPVIPGRAEGSNPESSRTDVLSCAGFRIGLRCKPSGMTNRNDEREFSTAALL